MPQYNITDPKTGRSITLTGDSPPTEQELEEVFASLPINDQSAVNPSQEVAPMESAKPEQFSAFGKYVPGGMAITGVGEPLLQVGTGAINLASQGIGAIGGGAAEFAKQTFSNEPYNKDKIASEAALAMTEAPQVPQYQPSTREGMIGSEALGDAMASPLNPLNYGRQINQYFGGSDKLAEAGQPALATGLEVGADLLSGYGVGKIVQKSAQAGMQAVNNRGLSEAAKREDQIRRIMERTGDRDLASVRIERPREGDQLTPQNAKIKEDREAIAATKQGFDDGVVSAIKASSPETKKNILKMVNIKQTGKNNETFAASNRPSDIVGDSLAKRIKYVKTINQKAGNRLDSVAQSLRGQPVDTSPAVTKLMSDLNAAGVRFDPTGKPMYEGSRFEGDGASQRVIGLIAKRARSQSMGDAYYAHELKKFIDNKTSYGANKAGATGDAERIIKDFRRNIDTRLDEAFPKYNKVNTTYSDTVNALNAFEDAAGSKVNLFGENADKALGTVSRRLLSNAQSRVNLMDSIKSIEGVSKKYGADFKDDIMTQVMMADEIDKVFGASAKTSLLGDIEKGTRTGIELATGQKGITAIGVDAAAKLANKARGVNEENAFKSIKELLNRNDDHIQ